MVNIVIIGTGMVATKRHMPGMKNAEKGNLYGFFDCNVERAQKAANIYGGKVYQSIEDVYADPEVDGVIICTPPSTHMSCAVGALNAGKYVLLEKPMTFTVEEARAIGEAEEKSGKKVMMLHVQREYDPHTTAKELLSRGEIGRLLSYRTFLGNADPNVKNGVKTPWWHNSLYNVGIHRIDLMRYITESEVAGVYCHRSRLMIQEWDDESKVTDDHVVGILEHKNGVVGTFITSRTSFHGEDRSTVLIGTEGAITTYAGSHDVIVQKSTGETICYDFKSSHDQSSLEITNIYDEFCKCIERNSTPSITAKDGIESIRIAAAMEKSDLEKKWVSLDEI